MKPLPSVAIAAPCIGVLFGLLSAAIVRSDQATLAVTATPALATPTQDVIVEIKLAPKVKPLTPFLPLPPSSAPPVQSSPTFGSAQLDRQWQRYRQYTQQHGVPDVLIIGSSRALQGIDPVVLQQTLEQHGYPRLSVYNFGINGATAQVKDWLLNTLLANDPLPRLIIWGDGSRAFNNGRRDQTFRNIVSSPGHRQLLAGTHPARARSTDWLLGQICIDALALPLAPAVATVDPASATIAAATRSTAALTRPPGGTSSPATPESAQGAIAPSTIRPVSASAPLPQFPCQQPIKLVMRPDVPPPPPLAPEALGFQTVSSEFHPRHYFQRYPRVPGTFDGDYLNFSLGGAQAQATDRVIRFAQQRQVPLVIVNLPLTNHYLDYTRSQHERQFRQYMQRLAQTRSFTFVDLGAVSALRENVYFADPSHLNRAGAIAVAQELGRAIARQRLALAPSPVSAR